MTETITREENKAILECLANIAPGVKWNHALASSFERMLLKRGFEIVRHTPDASLAIEAITRLGVKGE